MTEQRLVGLGVAPGVATGRAFVLRHGARDFRLLVPDIAVPRELGRLTRARDRSRVQLDDIKISIASKTGPEHAYLFDAQLLMLDDPMLVERAAALVREERLNAEWAVQRAFEELAAVFAGVEDPYLRERQGDVADVVGRLLMNLRGSATPPTDLLKDLEGPFVLVADELAPSVAAQMDWTRVVGFVMDGGSATYHTSILARSLHVPAVVGLSDASVRIPPGAVVAMDGSTGEVLIDPSSEVLQVISARRQQQAAIDSSLQLLREIPAITLDGVHIRLEANIELSGETASAVEHGAEGIGLYRSEFLLARSPLDSLDEEVQYAAYRSIVEGMAPAPVTIRTFDIDEEQVRCIIDRFPDGSSGRLGLRAIRLSLAWRDMFRTQLRALVRAAAHGPLRILFPFVSSVEELRDARMVLNEAITQLNVRGIATKSVPVGVMIEVPSAGITADLLANEADFFSIGTNDLIQYCLAVDRTDCRVSHLYNPLHPAILRTVRRVGRIGRRRHLPVAVCGEMASDPSLLLLLVGLGIREFSMTPTAIPLAKQVIRGVRSDEMTRLAARLLRGEPVRDIEDEIAKYVPHAYGQQPQQGSASTGRTVIRSSSSE